MGVAKTTAPRAALALTRGLGTSQPLLLGPPHPPASCAEGRLRPGMPPKAVPSKRAEGADPGLVLEGESGEETEGERGGLGEPEGGMRARTGSHTETGGKGGPRE